MIKICKLITLLLLFALILTKPVPAQNLKPKTVLSFEVSYFKPRRAEFKELYGTGVRVGGIRLDFPIRKNTSISIRGRYFRMSEIDSLAFTNTSLGLMVKRTFPENEIIDYYLAVGVQFEYRRVGFSIPVLNGFPPVRNRRYFNQQETTLSVAAESGIDVWVLSRFKLSPSVGFHYFPFGDPTTGDFGDTGGFMFSASLGFRL